MNKSNNLFLFIKSNWVKLLLLFIASTFCYSKYFAFKLAKSVEKTVATNEFINYTQDEYLNYFEENGFEVNTTKDNNELLIVGQKDNQKIRIEFDNTINGQKSLRFDNVSASNLPLIEGINANDTFNQIKRKLHLNPFVTMYNFIIGRKYCVSVADNHIMITDGSDDSNYAYYLIGFNEEEKISTIIIYCCGIDF